MVVIILSVLQSNFIMARGRSLNRRRGNAHAAFQNLMDNIASNSIPPSIISGCYTLSCNQMTAITHLDNIDKVIQGASIPGTPAPQILEAKLQVVGSKTGTGNQCCMTLTLMFACLILPLFCMCCSWWKSIVNAKYEMNIQFYKSLGRFLRMCTSCTALTVTVVDNAFDKKRAAALFQSLQGTQLTSFVFQNKAVEYNYNDREASDFEDNMQIFKTLPFPTVISWGSMKL